MPTMKVFSMFYLLILLSGCSELGVNIPSKTSADTSRDGEPPSQENLLELGQAEQEAIDLSTFFMQDGAVANYLGEGNEFASYQARTQCHYENTVFNFEDIGGTVVLRTYRITKDSIDLIQEKGEYYENYLPSGDELDKLPVRSTFLGLPLQVGATFDEWTILGIDQSVEIPLQNFEQAIILEKQEQSGAVNRKYIVRNFGEVKREYVISDVDTEFIVTSTLASIK